MQFEFLSSSSSETEQLGLAIGSNLKGGEVIELISDLGGGKTTFTKGLALGAGSEDLVASPSFTISYLYSCKNFNIHHFDFYRLTDPGVVKLSIAEAIELGQDVIVIEWGDIVSDALPENKITIKLSSTAADSESRKIEISAPAGFEYLIESLPFRGGIEGGADTSEDLK